MIDHDAEKIEALPHELACFETYAEKLIEAGDAETGEHDEVLATGLTVMTRFHLDMDQHRAQCECQAPIYAAMEARGELS